MIIKEYKSKYIPITFSLLILLSFFTFGNFGLLNIFNLKRFIYYPLLISILTISLIPFVKNYKKNISNPLLIIYSYMFFSSLLLNKFELNLTIKLAALILILSYLLSMSIINIDRIIKGGIVLSFIFSIVGIGLFIYYQFNPDLLIGLERVFRSYDKFTDLSHIPIHQKFGFVIETPESNLFGMKYIRSRSFFSEPSASVPLFFTLGILSLLYDLKYKILGSVVLFFSIVLIYSGSSILSLIISALFFIWIITFKPRPNIGSAIIIVSIISFFAFIFLIDISLLESITPESKVTSLPSRLIPITKEINELISNPIFKDTYPESRFIGLGLICLGVFPTLGCILTINMFYNFLKALILSFNDNMIFSALMSGLIIQIVFFSSGGFLTIPGSIILCLSWIKINQLASKSSPVG